MLFQARFHDAIRRGELSSTIRIWHSPRVRVGARYALGGGSIEVQRIQEIEFDALTPALARRAGFASVVELLKVAKHGAGERIFLIDFRYFDAPARTIATNARMSADDTLAIIAKLDGMDRRAAAPWTRATLRAIADAPGRRATDIAAELGCPRDDFKRSVRKLKALGLTISLDVGYRLSPRGTKVLERLGRTAKAPSRTTAHSKALKSRRDSG